MADLPERTTDSVLDDTQGINLKILDLYNRFILPIERTRSFSAPTTVDRPVTKDGNNIVNDVANNAESDPSQPKESRTHAFYRMIGFPVINENGEFYNPGFDPIAKADQRIKNNNIAAKVSSDVRLAHTQRETGLRSRLSIFSRGSVDACIYSIAIAVPNGTKPFLQMNTVEGFDSNTNFDPQKFNVPNRINYIKPRYEQRNGSDIINFFDSGEHILRPFNVDPNIADTVSGFSNETRVVSAPFLPTKKDTAIERGIFAKRPGLEFILRLRLNSQPDTGLSSVLLGNIDVATDGDLTNFEIAEVVSALINVEGSNISNEDIVNRIKNASEIEIINLNKLVKTIKGIVGKLVDSIDDVKNVSKKIKWTPIPDSGGPENGVSITSQVKSKQDTEIESRIRNLFIRASESKRQGTISNTSNFVSSEFHLSTFENPEKVWDKELLEETEKRDNIQRLGSDALSFIEIITGEVSGLGLIDILAIYTALWAIDIEVLISMLDEKSFDRLYRFNSELRTQEVESRRASGPQMNILEAMQVFERQVINILSYADRIFSQKIGSPINSEGGDVPRVEQ